MTEEHSQVAPLRTEYRIGYTAQATLQFPRHTRYTGRYAGLDVVMNVARHLSRTLEAVHVHRISDGAVTPPDEYDMPHWRKAKP
jgi:hypothetical protein